MHRSPGRTAPQAPQAATEAVSPAKQSRGPSSRSRVSSPLRKQSSAADTAPVVDSPSYTAAAQSQPVGAAAAAADAVPSRLEQLADRGEVGAPAAGAAPSAAFGLPAPRFSSRLGPAGESRTSSLGRLLVAPLQRSEPCATPACADLLSAWHHALCDTGLSRFVRCTYTNMCTVVGI